MKRGGGVKNMRYRSLSEEMMVVDLFVDVKESMGANLVNTIAENTAPLINEVLQTGRTALRILSNLCTERMSRSDFRVPVDRLAWKGLSGSEVAHRVQEAYDFARLDEYRATTHNKGVMNGIDAAAIAAGQDWRAIESAAHAYVSLSGRYLPMT